MIVSTFSELEGVKPCKHCGKLPQLLNNYYENGKISQEICCQSEYALCSMFGFVEVEGDLEKAKEKWNNGEY